MTVVAPSSKLVISSSEKKEEDPVEVPLILKKFPEAVKYLEEGGE